MLHWNTGLRPKRSASIPDSDAPSTMPKKLELASRPAWAELKPNSALIEPRRKVIIARSMESKKNAKAMMMKISR
ncbi:hypothetical protein P308_03735 [Pseudomonas piscis]|nr:hypothetical protein P308_03735 [Pseudomonas piscis]